MKLTVFQSDKGDCLLLETSDGKLMLIDGGMKESYTRHVAPSLDRLRRRGKSLDVVYASHIDRDHVYGLLQMMEDLVKWRVYDHFKANPSPGRRNPRPPVKRPPDVKAIWHNVFHELVEKNSGPIRDMLAANARALVGVSQIGSVDSSLVELEEKYQGLASSMADAVELSWRVSDKQLGIPLNSPSDGKLMLRPTNRRNISLGNASIDILGPSPADLKKLRDQWNKWLEKQKTEAQLERLRRRHRSDEDSLATSSLEALVGMRAVLAQSIGKRTSVTQPNLASLMLFVEDAGKTILLTGDGHSDDVLAGLKHYGRLGADGLHVDVLKVPHHGSEHNADEKFCETVIADDYVFCGDGAHENPDLRILDAFAESRIGPANRRSTHPKAGNRCRFLFSSSELNPNSNNSRNHHMRDVRKKMEQIHERSDGKITFKFLEGDRDKLTLRV